MAPQVSEAQSEILHEQIVPVFLQMLDDAPAFEDPAELEQLAATVLRRPGAREVQAAMLAIEHEHTGGALVQCALAPPARFHDARELLDGIDGASAPEPVAPGELAARAVTAARRALERDVALGHEAGPALPIVARALTGDPAGLPRPVVLTPWED